MQLKVVQVFLDDNRWFDMNSHENKSAPMSREKFERN